MKTIRDLEIKTREIPCDLCSSTDHILLFSKMRHGINLNTVVCAECALVFTNPQPTKETIDAFYRDYYHIFHKRTGINDTYITKSKRLDARRVELLKKVVNLNDQGKKLLEIGSGSGQFIKLLQNSSQWEVTGLEPGKESYDYCRSQGLNVLNNSIEEYESEIRYDIISAFLALDHLTNPLKTLKKCYSLLNEDGLIYIESANFSDPGKPFCETLQLPRLFAFTPISLTNYLNASGFDLVYISESHNKFSVVGKKSVLTKRQIIKTDIPHFIEKVKWVDKVHTLAQKIPGTIPVFKKIKYALSRIKV